MPHLSRAHDSARRRIEDLAARALAPEALAGRLLAALQDAVPADMQMLFGVDPASTLPNRLLALGPEGPDRVRDWVRASYDAAEPALAMSSTRALHARLWLQHVFLVKEEFVAELTFPEMMRAGIVAAALSDRIETSWGAPPPFLARTSPGMLYQAYHGMPNPAGGGLRLCLAAGGRWVAAFQCARLEASPPFRRSDFDFLRLVAPTMARALRAALDRESALAGGDSPGAPGVLVLSPGGRVLHATAAAGRWIDLMRDGWSGRPRLPTAVLAAVARLSTGGDALVRAPSPVGTVRVHAATAGEGGEVAVVLAGEWPAPAPELPTGWPLTEAERRVLALVVRGFGNRRIATVLCLSEHTVESHLTHAYGKLEVRGRTQLLARLFAEGGGFGPS